MNKNWQEIRKLMGGDGFELGPYFGDQLKNFPRHILFTCSRYKFAARMLPQDRTIRVLELGCSEGIGTLMLAERGHTVTAVDEDDRAIAHAAKVLKQPNITFQSVNFIGK